MSYLLLESGSHLLLESSSHVLLEGNVVEWAIPYFEAVEVLTTGDAFALVNAVEVLQ